MLGWMHWNVWDGFHCPCLKVCSSCVPMMNTRVDLKTKNRYLVWKLSKPPNECSGYQLKRWLECHELKKGGRKRELGERISLSIGGLIRLLFYLPFFSSKKYRRAVLPLNSLCAGYSRASESFLFFSLVGTRVNNDVPEISHFYGDFIKEI